MALKDWIHGSGGSAVAVSAVIAVQEPQDERKTAKTATTATAKAGKVAVDLATPTGTRTVTVTVTDNQAEGRITEASIYTGKPTPEAIDLADGMLEHIANHAGPVPEADIIEAVGGEPTLARNILHRLALDGICEALPGGLFGILDYPPKPADLPHGCPLTGVPFPGTGCCAFEGRMLRRLLKTGALPLPGGRCPLRAVCKLTD
jgi:hypothetical protein